jgi:hypothetical protein
MPIDIRYHAVSLLAVFLALVLGILVGFAMVDPSQMQEFVDSIKKDNARTRDVAVKELDTYKQKDKASQDFEKSLLPLVIKNRLANRRVAIVLDRDYSRRAPDAGVQSTLEAAGAQVVGVITLRLNLAQMKEEEAASMLARRGTPAPPENDPRSFLAQRLAKRLVEGNSDLPAFLEDKGLIRIASPGDLSRPVSAVVIVGGGAVDSDFTNLIEVPFLRALKDTGIRIVGCERTKDPGTAVEFFQSLDLTTVDCVDTYPGQAALVLALASNNENAKGSFGMKASADRVMPDLPNY